MLGDLAKSASGDCIRNQTSPFGKPPWSLLTDANGLGYNAINSARLMGSQSKCRDIVKIGNKYEGKTSSFCKILAMKQHGCKCRDIVKMGDQ